MRPASRYLLPLLVLTGCASAGSVPSAGGSSRPPTQAETGPGGGPRARWLALLRLHGHVPAGTALPRCPATAVFVPGGTFQMGAAEGEGSPDEHPRHPVTLHGYCMDRLEIAVDAYTHCVSTRACTPAANGAITQGDLPITGIDWQQAAAYCRFVGGRLPTEAEWEFAARGVNGRTYPWGNEAPVGCDRLDWTPHDTSCNGVGPSPVGSHPSGASPLGLQDLAGNVWEWTADWYTHAYDPAPRTDPVGPRDGTARVTRGGGWNNDQTDKLRASYREGEHPAFHDYDLGVRCAFDAGP